MLKILIKLYEISNFCIKIFKFSLLSAVSKTAFFLISVTYSFFALRFYCEIVKMSLNIGVIFRSSKLIDFFL